MSANSAISRIKFFLCAAIATLLLAGATVLATPQKAEAAVEYYPGVYDLYLKFDGVQALNYWEYTYYSGALNIETGAIDESKLGGIVYDKSTGTLTIGGTGAKNITIGGNTYTQRGLLRVYVLPQYAGSSRYNLTIDFTTDTSLTYTAESAPIEYNGVEYQGTIINPTGGKLVLTSSNGSTARVHISKGNAQSPTTATRLPVAIRSAGSVYIGGSLVLKADAGNNDLRDNQVAYGIWSGDEVHIKDSASVDIYAASYCYTINDGVTAAIRTGGARDERLFITSTEKQYIAARDWNENNPGKAVCIYVPGTSDVMYKLGTDSEGHGKTPQIDFRYYGGAFGYCAAGKVDAVDKNGYIMEHVELYEADGGVTYYSDNGHMIDSAVIKFASMPQLGKVPEFNAVPYTQGITIVTNSSQDPIKWEYTLKDHPNTSDWISLPAGAIIPVNAVYVRVQYVVQTQPDYFFFDKDKLRGGFVGAASFTPEYVITNSSPNQAKFKIIIPRNRLLAPDTAQYVSIMDVPYPSPGKSAPAPVSSRGSATTKGRLLDPVHYGWANLASSSSSISYETYPYREWWTNSRGQTSFTFVANEQYTYHALLQADDGYAFGGNVYPNTGLHTFVNGYATSNITYCDDGVQRYVEVRRTFTCPPNAIDQAEVYDVPIPQAGQSAAGTATTVIGTVAPDSLYKIVADRWRTGRTNVNTAYDTCSTSFFTGTFQESTWYTYEADLVPINNAYAFNLSSDSYRESVSHGEGVEVYINGEPYMRMMYTPPGSSYENGMVRVRYSFLVPPTSGNTISNIDLTTNAFGYGKTPGTSATSQTAGVTVLTMENAPNYASIGTNSNCSALRGKTGVWLAGDEGALGTAYYQAVYGGTPVTLATSFAAGNTYSFYAVVDLGDSFFSFDSDGNLLTTATVNGVPARLSYDGVAGHKGMVTLQYRIPSNSTTKWLIIPDGCSATLASSAMTRDESASWNGYSWYSFSTSGSSTIRLRKTNAWQPPTGQAFWKWLCTTGNVTTNYPQRPYVDFTQNSVSSDVAFRILTAPEGSVPTDISLANSEIYVDGWTDNWGGGSATYDGSAKLRWPVIKNKNGTAADTSDDITLTENVDYTLSYTDNVNAGTVTVTITGIGSYDGIRTSTYEIGKCHIDNAVVTFDTAYDYSQDPATPWVYWTGAAQTPSYTVTFNGVTLEAGTDYELYGWSGNSNTTTTARLGISGLGNFRGTKYAYFDIRAHDISEATIEAIPDQLYTGSQIQPELVITYEGQELELGTHYTLTNWNNNYHVTSAENPASFTIRGRNSAGWTGELTLTFNILPVDISNSDIVSWDDIPDQGYNGYVISPTLTGRYGTHVLSRPVEYTVTSTINARDPGTATITVEGAGDYTGTKELTFEIYADLSASYMSYSGVAAEYPFSGPVRPKPVVKVGETTLTEGVDYDLQYANNTTPGSHATVTVVPKDTVHFRGSYTLGFDITDEVIFPFTDVGYNTENPHWVIDDNGENWLKYVYENGLMNGYASTFVYEDGVLKEAQFGPDDELSRAMVATILYRATPGVDPTLSTDSAKYTDDRTGFTDAVSGEWYTEPLNWAKEEGIFKGDAGTGYTTVRPNDGISRQELATVFYRWATGVMGADTTGDDASSYEGMTGADLVDEWAEPGMGWCFYNGVIGGVGGVDLAPEGGATRAMMAKMITKVVRDVI